ncbi:MAG: hydroxymethylglutaryl-CoA lyase [Phycisphaeraceae bacterium]|nr:hydroxymethylglutaryl-CoA lyase [Phycisphaeraceae bacterium]
MSDRVRITDVAPRDGLQNEPGGIPAREKAALVDALSAAGVDEVEVSSFVSPKWVPQLGDAAEVFSLISPRDGVVYSALVPNERGLSGAMEVRAASKARHGRALPDKLAVFTAASQTFSRKNTNATIEETIERFAPIAAACRGEGIPLRGYISCIVACPFEGAIEAAAVARVARMLVDLGVDEIDLGDTIGAGTPDSIGRVIEAVMEEGVGTPGARPAGGPHMTLHLHDTFGAAASCVERSLAMGVRSFDASAGGLGGCPYASTPGRRAPGNIATATLLQAIERAGLRAGAGRDIDPSAMHEASTLAATIASRPPANGGRS